MNPNILTIKPVASGGDESALTPTVRPGNNSDFSESLNRLLNSKPDLASDHFQLQQNSALQLLAESGQPTHENFNLNKLKGKLLPLTDDSIASDLSQPLESLKELLQNFEQLVEDNPTFQANINEISQQIEHLKQNLNNLGEYSQHYADLVEDFALIQTRLEEDLVDMDSLESELDWLTTKMEILDTGQNQNLQTAFATPLHQTGIEQPLNSGFLATETNPLHQTGTEQPLNSGFLATETNPLHQTGIEQPLNSGFLATETKQVVSGQDRVQVLKPALEKTDQSGLENKAEAQPAASSPADNLPELLFQEQDLDNPLKPSFEKSEALQQSPLVSETLAVFHKHAVEPVQTDKTITLAPMQKHFVQPEWKTEFSERIYWVAKQDVQSAQLHLNPKHLGPVSITLEQGTDNQTSINFQTQHAVVRDAIEAALPKLRELFHAQQLNLADVNVSQQHSEHSSQQQDQQEKSNQQNNQNQQAEFNLDEPQQMLDEIESGRAIASQGLLNIFA